MKFSYVKNREITLEESIPEDIISHPGMIPIEERVLLYSLAKNRWSGRGCIVDAGAFLGVSTRCFYRGVSDSGVVELNSKPFGKPIKTYEKAVATHTWSKQIKRNKFKNLNMPKLNDGESFADEFHRFSRDLYDLSEINLGDILLINKFNHPIEILFLDILKSPQLIEHCAKLFFGNLIIGSYVIQQDYNQSSIPGIKVFQEKFSGHFEHVANILSSAVFRLKTPIPYKDLENFFSVKLSKEEKYSLHEIAEMRENSDARRLLLKCSRCILMLKHKDAYKAKDLLSSIKEEFHHILNEEACEASGFSHGPRMRSEVAAIEARIGKILTRRPHPSGSASP